MSVLNQQKRQVIERNFSLAVDFLNHKFGKTQVYLPEVPSYLYKGKRSKLEIRVCPSPHIANINVRIICFKSFDREPAYECNYDLDGLSIPMFQRAIDELVSQIE